jgi:hypothetical protein
MRRPVRASQMIRIAITSLAVACAACAACGGGAASAGPATVAEALRARPAGVIDVRGHVIVDPNGNARLCEGLAGSYPPQCGEPSVAVTGLDPRVLEHPETASGVTWGEATLRGRLDGDVLRLG